MNFRDVLKALALYPGDALDARIFGDEIGGVVRAIGRDVTHLLLEIMFLVSPSSALPRTRSDGR